MIASGQQGIGRHGVARRWRRSVAATVAVALVVMQLAPLAAVSLSRAPNTDLVAYAAELGLSVDEAVRMRILCVQIARVLDPGGTADIPTAGLDCPFCRLFDAPYLAGRSADAWVDVAWPTDYPRHADRTWAVLDPPPLGFAPRAPPSA